MKFYIGLAGPLLKYIYLPLALIGLWILFVKIKSWKNRLWAVPLYLVLAYAIPLGDVTWHSWKMAQVCPKAGLQVYRTVVVDGYLPGDEYVVSKLGYQYAESRVDPSNGLVTRWERTESGGVQRLDKVPPRSEWEEVSEISMPDRNLGVSKSYAFIRNRITGEIIAEQWYFSAWRGWIDAWIGSLIDNSPGGCGSSRTLYGSIPNILIPRGRE